MGRQLASLVGRSVDLIGKGKSTSIPRIRARLFSECPPPVAVANVSHGKVQVETSDKFRVDVVLLHRGPGDEQLVIGSHIEFVGTVNPDGSISEVRMRWKNPLEEHVLLEAWNAPPWQVERFSVPEPFDLETYGEMLTLATERFAGVGMF